MGLCLDDLLNRTSVTVLGKRECFSAAKREEEHRGALGWQSLLLDNGVASHRERHRAQTYEAMT